MKGNKFPKAKPFKDRHGRLRWRVFHKGKSFQLGADFGSDDFKARYDAALKAKPTKVDRTIPGTLDALVAAFYRSAKYMALGQSTKTTYSGIIDRFRRENGRGKKMVKDLRRSDVLAIMASMSDHPAAANNLLRMLRMLMKHAIQLEWRETDPTLGVDKFPTGDGHKTWSEIDILKFTDRHPPGTDAHTALTLMLYTGAARADVVRLGWQNVKDGRLRYRRQKMLSRDGMLIDIPLHPELANVLDRLPRDAMTFLQTQHGSARSPKAFGNTMRKWCNQAGLEGLASHGLRKAMARRLAEAGCRAHEIAAVTGHRSIAEVAHYTEAADRVGLADRAIDRLGESNVRRLK